MKTIEEMKTAMMPYVIGAVVGLWSVWILGLSIVENTASAVETPRTALEWQPWMLNESWDSQLMPILKSEWSHERFKELCKLYGLDASLIWEIENRYGIREWVLLAILIAETSWGHNWNYVSEGCYNLWNVGNNDRWDRVCFEGKEESIERVGAVLVNRYLWKVITLGCLSNAWSCVHYDDRWYRYATSNWNRERNLLNVLNLIYGDELGEIEPSKFSVRRDFISLQ